MKQSLLKEIKELAKKYEAIKLKEIPISKVKVADWVRLKCQYGCPCYSTSWCCPPQTPKPAEFQKALQHYTKALIIRFKENAPIHKAVHKIERKLFLSGFYKAFGLACGPCDLCPSCSYPKECKHPYKARPAMEACGIDVYATARNNGFKIGVVKSLYQVPRYFGLILIE